MKEKLSKIFKDKKLYLIALITILFFGILIKLEFATDTYCVFATSKKQYCEFFLYSGRFVSAMFLACTDILKFNENMIYLSSYILAIISTIVSIYILYNIFKRDIKKDLIALLVSILIIINVFSIELYLFLEKGVLMLSVLLCVCAFKRFVKYLEENKKINLIWCFILMLIANFSYQGTVGLFVALSTIYIIKYSDKFSKFIKNNIVCAICYGIPALVNYLVVKLIFNNSRVSGERNIIESINKICKMTKDFLLNTFNIIPKYVFFIVLSICIICCLILIIKKKNNAKQKLLLILKVMYIVFGTYIVAVAPQIMQSTESIGFAPRNTYTFASIIGILIAFIYMEFIKDNIEIKINKIINYLLVTISIILLFIQYIGFTNIEKNRYIGNYIDYLNVIQIKEKVEKYEEDTGIEVNKVAFYTQNGTTCNYPSLFTNGDINIKATSTSWSRMDYLRYYLNIKLDEVATNEDIYNKYFKDKKWQSYSENQIIIINDTIHMCLF